MEKKTERLIVRLTKEELEKLKEIALIEDKSVSDVIRGLIKFRSNYYEKNHQSNMEAKPVRKVTNLEPIDEETINEFKSLLA